MKEEIRVIIPAFNEENAVANVIREIPKDIVSEVIVVNNASTDNTAEAAIAEGATVLRESRKGYGYACLKGIDYLRNTPDKKTDIVVFLDADYSDFPAEMTALITPILRKEATFVIGSRSLGGRQKGAMQPQQIFGNWLATWLMKVLYSASYSDLGPFRAIKYDTLLQFDMQDKTYGWTVEMQLKAIQHKVKYVEVPVNYRPRVGKSKISGTVKGTLSAGYKIIWTIIKYL